MSYTSLPFTYKLFQLTSLTCALALAGCGGGGDGDTVDSVAPAPDLGVTPGTGSGNNAGGSDNTGGNGGEQVPNIEPDFFLQKITVTPNIIELTDEDAIFKVTVKAVEKNSGGAVVDKDVSLMVKDSEKNGITIEGKSVQRTDKDGNAVYTLKLNPQAVNDKAALIKAGFILVATANTAEGKAVPAQELKVSVSKKGSGDGMQVIASKLSVKSDIKTSSVSNNVLNPYGDTAIFNVEVKDEKGALVPDVTVGLGIAPLEGVSISPASQKTDNKGTASFNIKIDSNLSSAQRNEILKGITYAISIKEKSGATKIVNSSLKVAVPVSDYSLNIESSSKQLSAYGDSQNLTITANPKNVNVLTNVNGAKVTIKLNNKVDGVSLAKEQLTLDSKGQAQVALIIAPTLNSEARTKLAKEGVSYTVTLSEPNRSATVKESRSTVYIPTAQYKIYPNENIKKQLSSSGDSAVISFRVNDSRGGVVAGQTVTASLPSELAKAGLLTLESSAEQVTGSKGEVSYTVRVPKNLTAAEKLQLEKAGAFVLTATIKEASGVTSTVASGNIKIGSDIGQSDIALTAKGVPAIVSILDEEFELQVTGKRKDGSAANGRLVKLIINKSEGVTIVGNEQTTNNAGTATFTVRIEQNLTPAQREQLIKSGISYTAVLTDEDGTQSKITQTVKVEQPATSIQFASIGTPSISELGGSGNVTVKLASKASTNTPIKGQSITIKLAGAAQLYGVTVTPSAQQTDFNGDAIFTIKIPTGLTNKQRADLKSTGVSYQLSYVEKGITYNSVIRKVDITTPSVAFNILNGASNTANQVDYKFNSAGDNAVIQAQLSNQTDKTKITNQSVELEFDNKQLAKLLTVNGQAGSSNITANTDANGIVSFDIIVPNNLSAEQKLALDKQIMTATLTETLTNKQKQVSVKVQSMAAVVSLIAKSSQALNLNGGETRVEVTVADSEKNSVAGQKVFLALPAAIVSQGVTLVSGTNQISDNSGKAIFTIAVPNNLTSAQKAAIGSSFAIALTAADTNGTIVKQASTIRTVTPSENGTKESLTIGANKVVNTKGDTFKVFVRVTNNEGSIASREVSLNVDDPIKTGVTVTNGTATTNSDGVATFNLKLEEGANVNQAILEAGIRLTARTTTAENVKLEQNYIVAVDTATIESYQILASSDKPTLNTGGDQTNAIFRVTDSNGGVLSGVPVQLNIDNLAASGAALTTPSMVTTDASGLINVGVLLAANSVNARLNHSVVIHAKIVTPQYDAKGNVSMQVREEESLSLSATGTNITLAATATQLKDGEPTTITTTLLDGAGRAIANAGMELVNADGETVATNATTTTDSSGKASFNVNETRLKFDANGNLRIFARALGENSLITQRSTNSIDLVKVSQAGISFSNIISLYDVNVANTINVQIRTDTAAQATALLGKTVEVQTTLGKFANGQVITTQQIVASNINGKIINVPVQLTSELAGTTVLQATVLGETANGKLRYQTTVDTRFRATTPAKMLFQAVKSVITPGTSTEIVATVKDKNDVPVEGQTVVFSRMADSSAGRLSAATAVTDSKGEARVVYLANASSPIGGVIINARLLNDKSGIGTKTTNITVSKEAVYTTLAFSNKLSSDNIYYTAEASISVMDGSGRAVPNREVSIKSYAIEYAQGRVCLLKSSVSDKTREPETFSELTPILLRSNWLPTEDPEYNYTLDKNADVSVNDDGTISNGRLDPINPVAIIGGTVSDDGYTFVTDSEGRADFQIRYPMRYSNWVKVRFDASTFLNGSENIQSINYVLPSIADDIRIINSTLITPWIGDASAFGTGGATCINDISVVINRIKDKPNTTVTLSPYQPRYGVSINGKQGKVSSDGTINTFIVDFDEAFELGSTLNISNNGFSFSRTIKMSS